MFVVCVRAKDLQPGDRFKYWGRTLVAQEVLNSSTGVDVFTEMGWCGGWKNPDTLVELLDRPLPAGKTAEGLLAEIFSLAGAMRSYSQIWPSLTQWSRENAIGDLKRLRRMIQDLELSEKAQ